MLYIIQRSVTGNAASHALAELKPLLHERVKQVEFEIEQAAIKNGGTPGEEDCLVKTSYVSKLYEIANLHKMDIEFTTLDELGPPHVKKFYVKCKVGEKELTGTVCNKVPHLGVLLAYPLTEAFSAFSHGKTRF